MRRMNVRELHHHTGAVVDEVAKGEVVVIVKRGVPVAELRPLSSSAKGFPAEHWEYLKRLPKLKGDSGASISNDRDRG